MSQAGERIRAARLLLGMTQTELKEAAGVSQSLISAVEKGSREATADVVQAIASGIGMPMRFFADDGDTPTDTLRYRKMANTSQTEAKRVEQTVKEVYRVARELLRDMPDRRQLPRATGDLDPQDIEDLATETRRTLGVSDDSPLKHVTRACERAGIAVAPLVLAGTADDDETAVIGHSGASCWRGIEEPVLIGYFNSGPGDRQRFTLGHEVGHVVLHSNRSSAANAEKEAHQFAGALLFPKERAMEVLSEDITLRGLAELKARWGMSIQSIIMRGGHLGLISTDRKTSLYKQISARGWNTQEPVKVHAEQPLLLGALLAKRFGSPIPYLQAAEELGLPAVVLRAAAPPQAGAGIPEEGRVVSFQRG